MLCSFRCVVDSYVNAGSTVNICALEVSKAFDNMNHYGLLVKLMEKRVPVTLVRILEH